MAAAAAFGWLLLVLGATDGTSLYIYLTVDVPGFAVLMASLPILVIFAREKGSVDWLFRIPAGLLSLAVLALTMAGVHLVYHGYAFSIDEWMQWLQAEIFLRGDISAIVPTEWRDYGRAIFYDFALFDPNSGALASGYRPGMAALIAVFDLAGLGLYVSAFMTAGAVWLAASLARVIWPESASAPIVAALLVATSSQVLAAAISSFAMSAHLFFNLLWLRLFLLDRWSGHIAAAICGIATAALHQVHFHIFFAAPFFLLLLRPLRPGLLFWYAAVYAAGHLAIISWDGIAVGSASAPLPS